MSTSHDRFLTEWLLRMREVQSHGQGELKMARNEIARLMDRVAALEKLVCARPLIQGPSAIMCCDFWTI